MSCYYGGQHEWQDVVIDGQAMQQCTKCYVVIPG